MIRWRPLAVIALVAIMVGAGLGAFVGHQVTAGQAETLSLTPLVGTTGANGSNGSNGATGSTGPTGPAGPSTIGAPNSRSLSLATAYQCTDTSKPCMATVNITSTANFSLTGGTTNSAAVVLGATNAVASGTGSTIGSYTNSVTGTIAVGLNLNSQSVQSYTVPVPAGWFFAIRQTAGTVSIVSAFDQALG